MNTRRIRLALLAVAGFSVLGCGDDDDPTGPNFPNIPQAVIDEFCIRGNATVGQTRTGTVDASDCDAVDISEGGLEAYYEIWRVRVASNRTVTLDLSSTQFDTFLVVGEVLSLSPLDITTLDFNDDRSQTDTNSLLTVQLEANTDYLIAVAGFDYTETGSYTLRIQ